ncbi:hypothetical protein LCGC14_0823220 [marine sediment metagenome]|uniref:Uncharacterized protein n=1 Tax=marine sediment metagenome TaxID=412755 RepID=A0A0F9SQP0_9ZZZZ
MPVVYQQMGEKEMKELSKLSQEKYKNDRIEMLAEIIRFINGRIK